MRAEPEGLFFDTNILVYAQDSAVPFKQMRAREVIDAAMAADRFVISTQVMQEFYGVALRKRWMTPAHAANLLTHLAQHTVVPASAESVLRGVALQQRHRLSIWDALVVQAALDARCTVLYSEDLQDGQRFESMGGAGPVLRIVNPFNASADAPATAVHEEPAPYRVAAKKRTAVRRAK